MGKHRKDLGPDSYTLEFGGRPLSYSLGLIHPSNEERHFKRIRLEEPLTVIFRHESNNTRTTRSFLEFYVPEKIDNANKISIDGENYLFVRGRPIGKILQGYHNTNVIFIVINGEYIPYSLFRERNKDKKVRALDSKVCSLDPNVEIQKDSSGDESPLLEEVCSES